MKVLFMAGHVDEVTLLGRFEAGEAETIQEPFSNGALLGHLRRLLRPARATE